MNKKTLSVCLILSMAACGAFAQDAKKVDFARDIQPIFKESCFKCHGPEKQKGKLRLDSKAAAMAGGDNGAVIVPGKSAESSLYKLLVTKDEDDRMPQKADPLPANKIKLIKDWIDQGAVWPDSAAGAAMQTPKHWAYVAPVRPPLPAVKKNS